MPERDIFVAFAREHSKFIYFLLATTAGATVYALGEVDRPLEKVDGFAATSVACWMVSFWIGCRRLVAMLKGLFDAGTSGGSVNTSGDAMVVSGSSARPQLMWFIVGVVLYIVWFTVDNWPP